MFRHFKVETLREIKELTRSDSKIMFEEKRILFQSVCLLKINSLENCKMCIILMGFARTLLDDKIDICFRVWLSCFISSEASISANVKMFQIIHVQTKASSNAVFKRI